MKVNISRVKEGQIIDYRQVFLVESVGVTTAHLKTLDGQEVSMGHGIFLNNCGFADLYDEELTVNRTELIGLLTAHKNRVMTVHFRKKIDEKEVAKEIASITCNRRAGEKESDRERKIAKILKKALKGTPRTMRGEHYGSWTKHGRLNFNDADKQDGQMRQVDPRTMEWMIVDGIKYTVK